LQQFPVAVYSVAGKSNVLVMLHIDTKPLERKDDKITITVMYGLFDHNGKLVRSTMQDVNMRSLADATAQGLTLRANFEAAPGKYSLRVVARDSGGELMSAGSSSIEVN
jgi:hypothetical protein